MRHPFLSILLILVLCFPLSWGHHDVYASMKKKGKSASSSKSSYKKKSNKKTKHIVKSEVLRVRKVRKVRKEKESRLIICLSKHIMIPIKYF